MTLLPIDPASGAPAETVLPLDAPLQDPQAPDVPANGNRGSSAETSLHATADTQSPRWGMLCHKVQIHTGDDQR